ncbi:hypothetical protein SVEN_0022, partial [Streptomyces venezuelae ATCC 10712]
MGAWLREKLGVPEETSWKSRLRSHVIAGGPGDDRLGCDFRVHHGERTYLYEVTASVGSSGEIILGDSEVERTSRLSPEETYAIVYVSGVLSRERSSSARGCGCGSRFLGRRSGARRHGQGEF